MAASSREMAWVSFCEPLVLSPLLGAKERHDALKKALEEQGKTVFHTSEPGNENQKVSMILRDLILNNQHANDVDDLEREYLLALNRRIQYRKSQRELKKGNVVVQDRGWMSGLSYSQAKGFAHKEIDELNERLNPNYKQMFDVWHES